MVMKNQMEIYCKGLICSIHGKQCKNSRPDTVLLNTRTTHPPDTLDVVPTPQTSTSHHIPLLINFILPNYSSNLSDLFPEPPKTQPTQHNLSKTLCTQAFSLCLLLIQTHKFYPKHVSVARPSFLPGFPRGRQMGGYWWQRKGREKDGGKRGRERSASWLISRAGASSALGFTCAFFMSISRGLRQKLSIVFLVLSEGS